MTFPLYQGRSRLHAKVARDLRDAGDLAQLRADVELTSKWMLEAMDRNNEGDRAVALAYARLLERLMETIR